MLTLRNQTIKVNKNILLAKIKENLELYKLDYSETLQDYHLAIKNIWKRLLLQLMKETILQMLFIFA